MDLGLFAGFPLSGLSCLWRICGAFFEEPVRRPPYLGVEQFLNVIAETGLSTYPQKSAYQESYFSQELQWFAKQGESHIYW